MEENSAQINTNGIGDDPPPTINEEVPKTEEAKTDRDASQINDVCDNNKNDVPDESKTDVKSVITEKYEANDDARSLEDLNSLPAGDELALAAGSDSGVEGCGGRALSSGGGSRSCASSVVSCGSGCGSESSSLAGAPPRPRRRVTVAEPRAPAPAPRPVTAPRGPNLATRERARSREKPVPPEKPRPLTPKPRIRPTTDLPNLVRESPALRAKPTKTSTARCRTPNSPSEEKRWPANGSRLSSVMDTTATRVAADKYGTLPRRRREADPEGSPKHDTTPPSSRRPTVTRSASSRSATKTRVRIYAEKTSQTVLLGTDIESTLAGLTPNIESRAEVIKCSRGVQASARDSEAARLWSQTARAEAALAEERERRRRAEAALAEERAAHRAALDELERNSHKLLELAGAGAGAGAEGCLRALEEQLKSSAELANRQREEMDSLRSLCDKLHAEACSARECSRALQTRLSEAEREASEMQDFLAAETGALSHSLRDAEADVARLTQELDKRRAECRQLVRMCEQRRQEALSLAARARRGGGAAAALVTLQRRLAALTDAVCQLYRLPRDALHPALYHNQLYSRSDSGDALTPEEEPRGLAAAVARALRPLHPPHPAHPPHPPHPLHPLPPREDDRSRDDDDYDYSADLLDSETEPCLVTDPECAEEWWSGAECGEAGEAGEVVEGGWSAEASPSREESSLSERDSLRNLSAAIAQRQRSEAEDERGSLLDKVLAIDNRLSELVRALRAAAAAAAQTDDVDSLRLANALRDKIDITEKNVADVVVKKLAELDASKNMMDQYRQSVEMLKKQLAQSGEEDLELLEEELTSCSEDERRERYEALDAALSALASRERAVAGWARLARLHASLERLAFALAASPPAPPAPALALAAPPPLHTTA